MSAMSRTNGQAETCSLVEARADFARWLAEYGLTDAVLKPLRENLADQMPMPPEYDALALLPSPLAGLGMFTTRPVAAGELLAPARIAGLRTPAGRYTNHSGRPNARMVVGSGAVLMVARSAIGSGIEATIDYRHAAAANHRLKPIRAEAIITLRLRLNEALQVPPPEEQLGAWVDELVSAFGYLPCMEDLAGISATSRLGNAEQRTDRRAS